MMKRLILLMLFCTAAAPMGAQTIYYQNDFESCVISGIDFVQGVSIVATSGVMGKCGVTYRISPGGESDDPTIKLLKRIPEVERVVLTAWVDWTGVKLPVPGRGPHIFRILDGDYGPSTNSLDGPNIPAGASIVQLNSEVKAEGKSKFVNTSFNPTFIKGPQKWEVEYVLNTPGRADGAGRFWVNGVLRGELTGLNMRSSAARKIRFVDFFSNIGGASGTWPASAGYWVLGSVVVSDVRLGVRSGGR